MMVDGTVTNAPNAHVVLLVPSPIPGQADLQFETDLADFKFQIGVGSRLLHSMATLWSIPQVEDQQQPPVPFKTMLDSTLSFTFPTVAQMTSIRGVLRDSFNLPPPAFLARALVDNKVVSNVAPTDGAGGRPGRHADGDDRFHADGPRQWAAVPGPARPAGRGGE